MEPERTVLVCSDPKKAGCVVWYEKPYSRYLVLAEAQKQGWERIPGTDKWVCPDCVKR
ncbi:MAG: hypothetical protein UY56_C0029G0003 [Parcubacteria group bacterium GW2011_GWA1_50_14]|nr:MAG: hypothetical protein UY56_C0029G0003 [Parcubacteria group bacterium GW2011_GWA1_50_14]